MTKKTCCLHQVFRPGGIKVDVHGRGDCRSCVLDEKNKDCLGFCLITIDEFEIRED